MNKNINIAFYDTMHEEILKT